jgi:hypothetical protein
VVSASSRVDWNIIISVTGWQHGHPLAAQAGELSDRLAGSWAENEYATALRPAIEEADQIARQLLLEAQAASRAGALPSGGTEGQAPAVADKARAAVGGTAAAVQERGEREVDAATVGEMTAVLSLLARQGKRVRVSWQVLP